ncbi:MAG: type II toxin-antitoxin system VapC family toxin [Candidatus Competibacteraceae bacterium]
MKMLDTNICSYILRRHPLSVVERFAEQCNQRFCISALVAAELRFGAVKRGLEQLSRQIEDFLAGFPIHPWPEEASRHYAHLRAGLERQGKPIGNMDLLIAAHALAENAVLVTHNSREFERVPGLTVEKWT